MLNEIDLSRSDLNLLVLFEIVLSERHVGRAAERIHLTPSAVSHGLGRLRRIFNDPLFLKTPKGVVPTARALELAEPVADVLARARRVMSIAVPFDPRTSRRRFVIGAPDGASAVILRPLLSGLWSAAPQIDVGLRQVLPRAGEGDAEGAWQEALAELESRKMDVAILPLDRVPARFHLQLVYEEEFVIACRAGHPYAKKPSLQRFCEMRHLLVSHSGENFGFVDSALLERGLKRRVVITVPNFMFALTVLASTDLIAALPRRFVELHGRRHGVTAIEAPLPLQRFRLNAILPRAALMDDGLRWLMARLDKTEIRTQTRTTRSRKP
jgi:DNA-binding transcriptional LysR family regulator